MDGREGMALQGPGGYYMLQRGGIPGSGTGSGSGGPPTGMHSPSGFRSLSSQQHIPVQSNMGGSTFQIESSSAISHHGMNVSVPIGLQSGEPVKRKRGRPRKYGPDGNVALALSPLSSSPSPAPSSISPGQRRGRGRPPGTGRKQQLASLGEWISSSAGIGFTPHVITMAMGEDIATKIMSFSQQGPRAVCILSANGAVSTVTLRQPSSSGGTVTYEGRFEILCLSGSYMLTDNEGSRSRTGGLNVSLSSPDGRVIGGGVGGMLIAASPVQSLPGGSSLLDYFNPSLLHVHFAALFVMAKVIVGSFHCGGSKSKNKVGANPESGADSNLPIADNSATPTSIPIQTVPPTSVVRDWPVDMRNAVHVDIDLTRG